MSKLCPAPEAGWVYITSGQLIATGAVWPAAQRAGAWQRAAIPCSDTGLRNAWKCLASIQVGP